MKKLTDIEIIESILRGNSSDFALLVKKYKDKAFGMLRRMLKNEMDAEEVLQDSFLKAFNSLSSFRKDSMFSTWFYRIVYNSAISFLSSKKRRMDRETSSIDDYENVLKNENKIYAEAENQKEYLYKLIDELPIKNSLVLILFYIDGMPLSEISQVLNLSIVNTKVILHRSRTLLKDLIIKRKYQEEFI